MQEFLSGTGTHLWVMDDDVLPDRGCMGAQLATLTEDDAIVVSQLHDHDGEPLPGRLGWAALLTTRGVVERLGVPIASLVWGADDDEWLRHRCSERHHIAIRRDPVAMAHLHARDPKDPKPPWKYYYEARNVAYVNLYRRNGLRRPLRWKILIVRLWRLLRRAWQEPRPVSRTAMIGRGVKHGLVGRLGRRVELGVGERPTCS